MSPLILDDSHADILRVTHFHPGGITDGFAPYARKTPIGLYTQTLK